MRNHSILALAIMALWAGTAADAQYSGGLTIEKASDTISKGKGGGRGKNRKNN